jgi:hypothetical protein
MNTLNFIILYHRTLKSKTSDRIFIETKAILADKRFNAHTTFNYENTKEGIVITIDFLNNEEQLLFLEILKEKDLYLLNTLMSNY